MAWYQVFQDGPEFEARKKKGSFKPPDVSLKDVRDAVPRHLFERSTFKSIFYVFRHLAFTYGFYHFATRIDLLVFVIASENAPTIRWLLRTLLWTLYWGWQGVAFAGIWCLGHEKSTNNIERDETYIPPTRKEFKLPNEKVAVRMDYAEILEETPAYTLFKLFVRQFFGFQLYLLHNRKGNRRYPPGTSHYRPSSMLFKPEHRQSVILSNIAMCIMIIALARYTYVMGWASFWRYYLLPWLVAHNWIVTFTYLQHSDPTVPYYRKDQWTFARGALSTVDRPVFGWVGRFFFHNISSDHVAHHFFVTIPFYNLPEVTKAIKPVLGEYYNYDSTPVLYALWRSFTQCTFVEDEGDVIFFKNQYGDAVLEPQI